MIVWYLTVDFDATETERWERLGNWCSSRTSNPMAGPKQVRGGFDSHTLPPILFMSGLPVARAQCCMVTAHVGPRGGPRNISGARVKNPDIAHVDPHEHREA